MNILGFVLLVWAGIVVLAVGMDVGRDVWVEKMAERAAMDAKRKEAIALLHLALTKHLAKRNKSTAVEVKVVYVPKKPARDGGRHRRLTAA